VAAAVDVAAVAVAFVAAVVDRHRHILRDATGGGRVHKDDDDDDDDDDEDNNALDDDEDNNALDDGTVRRWGTAGPGTVVRSSNDDATRRFLI
jgi:hypothetical protein